MRALALADPAGPDRGETELGVELSHALDFELPPALEAHEPPEANGVARDHVRLLVAGSTGLTHTIAAVLPRLLRPGDLLVVNLSRTLPAALDGRLPDGRPTRVHVSGPHPSGRWVVELRRPLPDGKTAPFQPAEAGDEIELPGGRAVLVAPEAHRGGPPRLWQATLDVRGLSVGPQPRDRPRRDGGDWDVALARLARWLRGTGGPIRYAHVPRRWPISAYQTVFGVVPGSAEMPSAGRPFTARMLTALARRGIGVAPLILHAGVSSQEVGEGPLVEPFAVPAATAARVNDARRRGERVIAVGTTVVRALESAVGPSGQVEPTRGWTDLVVTPSRGVAVVDGLVTGWHEPKASHLAMLEAIAGRDLLEASYQAAVDAGYRWHEFGDWHLILPSN